MVLTIDFEITKHYIFKQRYRLHKKGTLYLQNTIY